MASLSLFVIESHSRTQEFGFCGFWFIEVINQNCLSWAEWNGKKGRWSQFNTVAHRGHATYIFISRDKNTVYRAINWELSRDKSSISRDKFQRHGYRALHDAQDDRLSYGCDCWRGMCQVRFLLHCKRFLGNNLCFSLLILRPCDWMRKTVNLLMPAIERAEVVWCIGFPDSEQTLLSNYRFVNFWRKDL